MHKLKQTSIRRWEKYLREQERSAATITKYLRALERFDLWLPSDKMVAKAVVIAYKDALLRDHTPSGVNTILAALNGFFRYMHWADCLVKTLPIQRRVFSPPEKELTRGEYQRLVETARRKRDVRLELLLQLMASTGIRVSEIRYVTAASLAAHRVLICLKGKTRTILLPEKLCAKLRRYQHQRGIVSGPIFLTRTNRAMDRREIWAQMKALCAAANVAREKVFPHNLRHLFARTFYNAQKDIAKLADVLGHSRIETTRIYLISSGREHQAILDRLQLIC